MKFVLLKLPLVLIGCMLGTQAHAYGGGGGGGSGCAEAEFYRETPARNSIVPVLDQFAITASDNTDLSTLDLEIDAIKTQPTITPQRSGEALIEVKPDPPIKKPGKVRITLRAKSKEGCETFLPIYLEIKP